SSFRLDEYRLPTMRASVVGPKTRTARPKALPLDLYVGFLSGGGAAGAPVKLRTAYQPLYDHPDGYEGWAFGGSPVREGTAALDDAVIAGQPVEIAVYTREIISMRRRLIGGFYAFDNSAKVTKLDAHCSAVTDARGVGECILAPGVSGEVIVVATTRDAEGNEARAVTSTYISGDDEWWFGGDNGDRMDLIANAREYH